MLLLHVLSIFFSTSLAGDADLFASVGVGSASIRGFPWTYDIRNPDLPTTGDPDAGKIYWVLTDDGVTMTPANIMAGDNPTQPTCFGQAVQEDDQIHEQRMDCTLVAGTRYRFWVAVDYNGDGTEAVDCTAPNGVPVIPQEDKDCDGVWSTCDANCIQTYSITQYPSGDGAGCEIGDEEDRICAPGTDLCPLGGSYDVYNPTANGFDLGFTPDAGSNIAGGMWYYMLTPPGATPTPMEIENGNGGLCVGNYAITDASSEDVQAVNCGLACATYDVWITQDPQGDGKPTTIMPVKQVTIPCGLPVGNLFAHSPTVAGHKISYDVDYPNANGKFYWMTVALGSPNPTTAEIRSCTPPCCGSLQQTVPAPMTTIDASCPLTPGTTYVVWGEVDTDGNGADASLANSGVSFQFTFADEPTTPPGLTTPAPACVTVNKVNINPGFYSCWCVLANDPCLMGGTCVPDAACPASDGLAIPSTSTLAPACLPVNNINVYPGFYTCACVQVNDPCLFSQTCVVEPLCPANNGLAMPTTTTSGTTPTTPTPVTSAQPGGLGTYRVVFPGQKCENDQIGDGATAHIHDTLLLPNVRVGYGSDVGRCAGYVSQNRAQNGGCSTLFHTGGATGECRCVRLGFSCDRDESEYGQTIFRLCLGTDSCNMAVMIPPDVILKKPHGDTGRGLPAAEETKRNNFFGNDVYLYLTLAILTGVVIGVCGYLSFQPRKQNLETYHIPLDGNRLI